jgi:hypothetical protein
MNKPTIPQIEINQDQVKNLLAYIDASQNEAIKCSIFGQLGRECFCTRKIDQWVESYHGNVQAFLDRVNIQQTSPYWERLEFTADRKTLILTGRKVQRCACEFADCPAPPKSLCQYCCKSLQEEIFGLLLGQKVKVTITEAYLLGGERCSTTIHLVTV